MVPFPGGCVRSLMCAGRPPDGEGYKFPRPVPESVVRPSPLGDQAQVRHIIVVQDLGTLPTDQIVGNPLADDPCDECSRRQGQSDFPPHPAMSPVLTVLGLPGKTFPERKPVLQEWRTKRPHSFAERRRRRVLNDLPFARIEAVCRHNRARRKLDVPDRPGYLDFRTVPGRRKRAQDFPHTNLPSQTGKDFRDRSVREIRHRPGHPRKRKKSGQNKRKSECKDMFSRRNCLRFHRPSASFKRRLAFWGCALPPDFFITCPTRKPKTRSFPSR